MASILRSCKLFRFIGGLSRSFSLGGTGRQDTFDSSVINHSQNPYRGLAIRALATQTVNVRYDSALDKSIKRLDQDARRAGRISRRELEEVFEEIKQTRSATSAQSLMVIRCCGSLVPEELPEVRTKLVQEIWNTLESLGVPMDISHYNALLRVYLENEHQFSPTDFLTELEKKGVEPNRVTYQRLISRYCQQGDMEGAAKILQIMKEKELPVNDNVFNALVTGHAQAGDMESARGIFGVMKQAGLDPGPDTYTALLVGYAKQGDMEAIRAILAECEAQKVDLIDRDLLTVIHALAVNGYEKHISEILGHIKHHVGYNQDCVNLILRLVNVGKEDVGLQLLDTMIQAQREGQESMPSGNFLIKQMVKAKRPAQKIISVCNELQSKGKNNRALVVALETALNLCKAELALEISAALKQSGLPVRQHYFWPLLAHYSKVKDENGLCEVLREMQTLAIVPFGETLTEYVVPGLVGTPENKVGALRAVGISVGSAASAVALHLLSHNNIKKAAEIVSKFKANYSFQTFKRPVTQAFAANPDVPALITLLQMILGSSKSIKETAEVEGEEVASVPVNNATEMAGQLVLSCFNAVKQNKAQILQQILQSLLDCGQEINAKVAAEIQDKLGAELTPEISELLNKLTSGTLVPQFQVHEDFATPVLEGKNLEMLYETLTAKGQPTKNVRRQLLTYYCRNRNLEKAEEIKQSLENENFVFTSGSLALLLDLYCVHEQLDKALEIKRQIKERDPDFAIDSSKAIRLAHLLIKSDKFTEAEDLLKTVVPREIEGDSRDGYSFILRNVAWNLLNYLAEKGNADELQKIFEALVGGKLVPVTNILLGPLIKVHVLKDDFKTALEKFEWCCIQHKATPWKNELACRFIQNEDATSLQKLTDLSTQVHGEVNSLYDLVLSFIDCGRIRQARRILETPGLRSRPFRLNAACQRFSEEGKTTSLEGLVEATKDMNHIDRANIYLHLLHTYGKAGDVDKAFGLWTQAQEEDVQLTDEFLNELGGLLQQHGRPVPFAMPEFLKEKDKQPVKQQPQKSANTLPKTRQTPMDLNSDIYQLRQAIRTNDFDTAINIKRTMEQKGVPLTVRDGSSLVEALTAKERVTEATRVVEDMLSKNTYPLPRVFRFLLNKLAQSGDIDSIIKFGSILDAEKKRIISYDNRLCNAYIVSGKSKHYLQTISKQLDNANTEEEFNKLSSSFPRGGAIGILEKCPDLINDYKSLAEKFAERGDLAPINVLWMHQFVNGNTEEYKELWNKHLSKMPRLMFQYVCQVARRTGNANLAADLFSLLVTSPLTTPGAKGNALSCLLDVLTSQNRFDEGLASLTAAQKDITLEYVNRTALSRLKVGIEEQGKSFPFTIPSKSASKATSGSSSDDEELKN